MLDITILNRMLIRRKSISQRKVDGEMAISFMEGLKSFFSLSFVTLLQQEYAINATLIVNRDKDKYNSRRFQNISTKSPCGISRRNHDTITSCLFCILYFNRIANDSTGSRRELT
jgi:hypothetical protein